MKLTPWKRFLFAAVPFAVLGAAFKVMTLVEGLTEVRPANAIPLLAGLLCGPAGALGCAAGNFVADFFGSLSRASVLGVAGNFLAAYLPWRLWYLFSREKPNVHSWKNLAIYAGLSLASALTVAWLLSFGLELFFGKWMEEIYRYVFFNNFAFSLCLGLPLFIVLTSDSVQIEPSAPPRAVSGRCRRGLQLTAGVYTALMALILAGVFTGRHLSNSVPMDILSAVSAVLLCCLCIPAGRKSPRAS